jgi:F-type H+-transporting ATPase subunit a
MKKFLIGTLIALVFIGVIVLGNYLFPVDQAAIEVAPEALFNIGPFTVTNAFFTSILLSLFILTSAFFIGRNLKEQPGGVQNIVEYTIEALDGLINTTAPKKWAATFFPILITIFIYLIFANWFSLFTPLWGSFGLVHPTDNGIPVENVIFVTGGSESLHHEEASGEDEAHPTTGDTAADEEHGPQVKIVPIFRAPSSDLNLTFALALMSMTLVQIFGVRERGFRYFGHFIRLDAFKKNGLVMGTIDFAVGLIEGISEFGKILSFSFRLFGNIFAGEVLLIVISSLITLFVVIIFLGFEIFVGLIQAFVFFILSLVFFSLATQHENEEH